ncbi:hypothetical protein DMN91_012606 [Ooceraea biroi]|uniref:Lymphoid-specific helicase n=1 Tax=Ooceraea biroi TaxID=2015173 RepID=A0A3L8D397_OOCBI|nr:lymphoid-specific helicase isoform X2 [Ooceraea biroi]RLU14719.1 hypothetical protein DMN91_012606 [Ooceraea biroi]
MEDNCVVSDNVSVNVTCNGNPSSAIEDTLIADNVTFNNAPLQEQNEEPNRKRSRNKAELESKLLAEEEYNRQHDEKIYKQLMHLLNKSQFYSNYLVDKVQKSMKKAKTTKEKSTASFVNDENIPPPPPTKRRLRRANINRYNIQKYMPTDIKEQIQNRDKNNLSAEEREAALSADSDNETKTTTSTSDVAVTPKYFHGALRDYQLTGLQWLKVLYENGLNGILADEMGLGKTIQVIALFCHLIEKEQAGPYLIIAPLSTLPNWLMEFERFAPDIPVVTFYGSEFERQCLRTKIKDKYPIADADGYTTQPVVITTYEIPLRETKFLQSQKWRYIVVDEGQRIKNPDCILVNILKTVQSMNRLILTGTPLQNNLAELWSLLNFLLPEIFDDLAVFESWFNISELQKEGTGKLLKQEEDKQVLMIMRDILKPFMLRREKTEVCLEIPSKKEVIVYAPLTELQYDLYKAVLTHNIEILSKIKTESIIPTIDGKMPKRRCFLRSPYGSAGNSSQDNTLSLSSDASLEEKEIGNISNIAGWETMKLKDKKNLLMWKQYTDVTERNKDFLINIHGSYRYPLYRKIVNHPYLVHCPLDDVGLPKIDEELIRSSGKLLVLDAMLAKLKAQGHKVLLFSTMTMILDMIENYLSLRDYYYVRLDGMTKIDMRKENIQTFNNDSDVFLFLISTRAGGIGLNLASADTVIIYDSDWNPQVDIQAMARCHRIGQTRPVVVYRLCTKGTIDEIIINRADTKRFLEKAIISKEWTWNGLDKKESLLKLMELINSKEYEVVKSKKEVFTEAELNKLLDRSDMI